MTGHLNRARKRLVSLGPRHQTSHTGTGFRSLETGQARMPWRTKVQKEFEARQIALEENCFTGVDSSSFQTIAGIERRRRKREKRPKYCLVATLRLGGPGFSSRESRMRAHKRTSLARSLAWHQLYLSAFSPQIAVFHIPTLTVQAIMVVNLLQRVRSFNF